MIIFLSLILIYLFLILNFIFFKYYLIKKTSYKTIRIFDILYVKFSPLKYLYQFFVRYILIIQLF